MLSAHCRGCSQNLAGLSSRSQLPTRPPPVSCSRYKASAFDPCYEIGSFEHVPAEMLVWTATAPQAIRKRVRLKESCLLFAVQLCC